MIIKQCNNTLNMLKHIQNCTDEWQANLSDQKGLVKFTRLRSAEFAGYSLTIVRSCLTCVPMLTHVQQLQNLAMFQTFHKLYQTSVC